MENEPQFLIAMNPKTQTLDLSMKNQTRRLQMVSFTADRVSKMKSFAMIMISIRKIMILIDCPILNNFN